MNKWYIPLERQGCNEKNIPHEGTDDYCRIIGCYTCLMDMSSRIDNKNGVISITLPNKSVVNLKSSEIEFPFRLRWISKMSGNVRGGYNPVRLYDFYIK